MTQEQLVTGQSPDQKKNSYDQEVAKILAQKEAVKAILSELQAVAFAKHFSSEQNSLEVESHNQADFGGPVSAQEAYDRGVMITDSFRSSPKQLVESADTLLRWLDRVAQQKILALDIHTTQSEIYTREEVFALTGALAGLDELTIRENQKTQGEQAQKTPVRKIEKTIPADKFDQIYAFFECAVSSGEAQKQYTEIRRHDVPYYHKRLDQALAGAQFARSESNPYQSPTEQVPSKVE